MHRRSALLLVLLTAACAPQSPAPTLPGTTAAGAADPVVPVGQAMVAFFRSPQPNQPAVAARAIADLEWLADSLPRNPRWNQASSVGLNGLQQARWEARRALGIPERAAAQAVINGLSAAAQAIEANDQAALARALPRSVFPVGPREMVSRLSAPPQISGVVSAYESVANDRVQGMVH
ncbi:hypothetical protein [Neoroseomonas lacus]|uniref:Uncharacterized protein n=1 Tax=Neoroseomonas lacus TaxID=287609 RepID=A0A917K4N3_9PROT|nr:hypothetical protein [Neoroseomonas lacus]GGI97769.1 hypothetical protein GCM10011320_00610 [Neoroseomonas lacus]